MLSEFNREQIFNLVKDNHSTITVTWHGNTKTNLPVVVIYADQDLGRDYPTIAMEWKTLRIPRLGKLGDNFIANEILYIEITATNENDNTGDNSIPGSAIARKIMSNLLYQIENVWNTSLVNLDPPTVAVPPVINIAGMRAITEEEKFIYKYGFNVVIQFNVNVTQTI